MLNLKLVLCAIMILISGCVVIPTYKAQISLKPTSQNKQDVQITSVLLVGTGSVASRIFLENLSTEIIQSFKSRGILSEFQFIGKIPESSSLKLESLMSDKFDTYFVFRAANTSYLDMNKEKYTAIGPGATATGYGNQYSEKYTVTMYYRKEHPQTVWQGDLAVDFDIANNSRYKQISKLIFDELITSQLILN